MKIEKIETIIKQNSVYSTEQWQVDNLNKLKNHIDSMHNLLTEFADAILKYDKYANWSYADINKAQQYLQDIKEKL